MADPSHLEKMGRELKCPICLSLLNSAVSLTCNHVFCNGCIMKSMKSGSNCPVCKVPYRRREVRAAPHMDNLVTIYKSMEVASEVNIFVTQNPPLDRPSDHEKQAENVGNDLNCYEQIIGGNSQEKADNQGKVGRRGSRRKSRSENCDPIPSKSSFPTNKRVLAENTKDEPERSSVVLKDNSALNEKGEPVLLPFFWLRAEDGVEKPSQQTDGDQLLYATPPEVPSFSDLKDSDDEGSPKVEVHGNSNVADLFDSEMFEWTQRPCSPELLPSPVKIQVGNSDKLGEIHQTSEGASILEPCTHTGIETINSEGVAPGMPSRSTATRNCVRNCKLKKISGKAKAKITRGKIAKRNTGLVSSIHSNLKNASESSLQKQPTGKSGSSLSSKKTRNKHKACLDDQTTKAATENVCYSSICKGKENKVDAAISKTLGDAGYQNLKRERNSGSKSNKQKLDSAEVYVLKEVSADQNQANEDMTLQKSALFVSLADDKDAPDFIERPIKRAREVKSALRSRGKKDQSCKKKMKVDFNVNSTSLLVEDHQEQIRNVFWEESIEQLQGSPNNRVLEGSCTGKKLPLENGVALQKCQTFAEKIRCAFCHSSEESEAAGEMVHYLNGTPVTQDYIASSKIMHSHKNCTEWAPNVYFEGDTAINLEAELSRSRRIKCSCCGLKGAALGCYEKSCRKSFHVPCARLMSQCRWDTNNFVMLCPLHASSKLPNEVTESQERRKECVSKEQLQNQCNQVVIRNGVGLQQTPNIGRLPHKLVICCSALTAEEREIVSEFEKTSGVTVLKKWDSSVTHVIASTDENGASRRTLKILMGILEGKWILNMEWVKACMKAMEPVDEEKYEIAVDIHGIRDGPRLGRLRLLNKQPKLFDGFKFYLMGDFVPSYKGYLQDLVLAAGGTILHRKPISGDQRVPLSGSSIPSTYIVYSLEMADNSDPCKKDMILKQRKSNAEALATSTRTKAVTNSWVLNAIAGCKLQNFS
ncbi:hypothetical protein SLE2022_147070 [Rubroshorea leprosula]